MAMRFERANFGDWVSTGERSGFLCVGRPIPGAERFGRVTCLGFQNFDLYYFVTERPCTGSNGNEFPAHRIHWDNESVTHCEQCPLVVEKQPLPAYGFAPTITETGHLLCEEGPYERFAHGPFGASDRYDLETEVARYRAEWTAWHGEAPWYASYEASPVYPVRHVTSASAGIPSSADRGNLLVSGPHDTLEAAYRAARSLAKKRPLVRQ